MIIRRSDLLAIGYLSTMTLTLNIFSLMVFKLLARPDLSVRLAILMTIFAMMYILARIFYGDPFKTDHHSPYLDSLIHALALIGLGSILAIIAAFILFGGFNFNIKEIYLGAKPAFIDTWNIYLPGYALIYWGINGLIVAYFYHSVVIRLLRDRGRFIGILAATILFAVNYNLPLISNYWNYWDIIFYGFIFAYSYSLKGSPTALLSAYLLNEVPLWWCILAPLGEEAFTLYTITRITISVSALILLLAYRLRKLH